MSFFENEEKVEVTEELLDNFNSGSVGFFEDDEDIKTIEEIREERLAKQRERRLAKKRERRSKLVNNLMPFTAFVLLVCTVSYLNSLQFGLVISYNDEQIATVENADVVEEATSIINNKIINKSLDTLEDEPKYQVAVINNNSDLQNSTELSRTILENDNVLADEICGVFVDGVFVGAVENQEDAESVLNELLAEHKKSLTDMGNVQSVEFNSSVSLQIGLYARTSIVDKETLKQRLVDNVEISYKVIVLQQQGVKIKYQTEYVVDSSKPSGYEEVTTKGQIGEGVVQNLVTYVDGVQISTERDKVIATTKPVNEVITVSSENEHAGTAKIASIDTDSDSSSKSDTDTESKSEKTTDTKADNTASQTKQESSNGSSTDNESTDTETSSASFVWPAPNCGSITNEFGYHDSDKLHKGIDISGPAAEGQPIVASASGYVTTAVLDYGGENYGCYLIIDHGNGYQTLYAQCSDIYVSSGDYVEQGETIAAVGSTGDSTGAHLHFEIIEYGEYVNPTNYLY